jgi:hypothetical protein
MVGAILLGVASPAGAVAGATPLQIRIVVVTTFPQGYLSLRYNAKDHVLGLDPRFDPSQASRDFGRHRKHQSQPGLGSLRCLSEPYSRRQSGL